MNRPKSEGSSQVKALLLDVSRTLTQARIPEGRLEAELLLAHVLGVGRIGLFREPERVVEPQELSRLQGLVRERLSRRPIQHLTETQEFWGRSFWTPPGVFIPRPETEGIIEIVQESLPGGRPRRVLDLGCGSGCLSVTLALLYPQAQILAIDLSQRALSVARANARAHGAEEGISFIRSDLADSLGRTQDRQIDLIVSNPPYLADAERKDLEPEVSRHEPSEALFAGPCGTELIDRILAETPRLCSGGGRMIMEIGSTQGPYVLKRSMALKWKAAIRKDHFGKDRYACLSG